MVHYILYRRGALIVRRLCVLLGAEKVYREFSTILEKEGDLDFASTMVQVCPICTSFSYLDTLNAKSVQLR
jgi:hypothetical protein